MPWHEVTEMGQRLEFVKLAKQPGANKQELCRRFGVSRKTGYKWLERFDEEGEAGLLERSRRPLRSPRRTAAEVEELVLHLRETHPVWGPKKLLALLKRGGVANGMSASTVAAILRRHGKQETLGASRQGAFVRFEHEAPNQLWQMDFKGYVRLTDAPRSQLHPFTVLDDNARYAVGLQACADQRLETVQAALTAIFRQYGLPLRITADNGSPWGSVESQGPTALGAWLIRLGVRLSHSRPYHPQTQGKDERFHRTLQLEVLRNRSFASLAEAQRVFDAWREQYNQVRPHEALGQHPPISRYQVSPRAFPEELPKVEYDQGEEVRKVQGKGEVHFRGGVYLVGRGLRGETVALRPAGPEREWAVYYCAQEVGRIREGRGRGSEGPAAPGVTVS